jgi:hypothetical protein
MRLLIGELKDLMSRKAISEVIQLLADMRVRVVAEPIAREINSRDIKVPFAK